jgi:hypothetical protein
MIKDPIVEEVRKSRRAIEKDAGGAEGVFLRYEAMSSPAKGRIRAAKSRMTPRIAKPSVPK